MNPRVCSQNSAGELDSENITACNRVDTAPFRHVSFAETVEVVELDPAVHAQPPPVIEYDTPAPNMAYRAHAAPAPMAEYDAAPTMAYPVYAAPAPVVEYDAPASAVEYQAHAAPAPVDEYDAPEARVAPFLLVDVPVVHVVQVPQVQVVEKTIEIPQLQTIEKIVDIPEIQTVQSTQSSDYLEAAPVLEMA